MTKRQTCVICKRRRKCKGDIRHGFYSFVMCNECLAVYQTKREVLDKKSEAITVKFRSPYIGV